MKRIFSVFTAFTAALFFAAGFAGCKANGTERAKPGDIAITEVCSDNKNTVVLDDGSTPDWIELKNVSDHAVELDGCGLTDNIKKPYRYRFGSRVLEPGEYLTVLCAKGGKADADFGISGDGEQIFFFYGSRGESVSVNVPQLAADMSYGLAEDGSYVYFVSPTPGAENGGEYSTDGMFETAIECGLIINEYMADNDYSAADENGVHYGWVEIKNNGFDIETLSDYYLSDDSGNPCKWKMPEKTLTPGSMQIIWLSGRDTVTDSGEIHASFKLSDDDDTLMIAGSGGAVIDSTGTPYEGNGRTSAGRNGDAWEYFAVSTPGRENSGISFASAEEAEEYLPEVYISEICSAAPEGADWVEIYNRGASEIDISGWGISDNKDEPFRFRFENTVIGAGEYLAAELADVGIRASGEDVFLSDAEGMITDKLASGVQREGMTAGRPEGSFTRVLFTEATKGSANTAQYFCGYASAPVFSKQGGYAEAGTEVAISAEAGESIYYTLDGSKPDEGSTPYSGPIKITETTCLRAVSYAPGKLPSSVMTENYLVGVKHEIPVVFVDMAPEDFNGSARGIYANGDRYNDRIVNGLLHKDANYWQDWEREMNFTFYEKDGTKGISFDAGIKIFGQYSREMAQKSFSIHLRSKYGQKNATYPFFRDSEITTFKSFLLRTSGQDWNSTKIFDAMIAQSVKGYTNTDIMEYRPCALYVNGEYWGIYNIREKMNDNYIESHNEGASKDKMDIIKSDVCVKGSSKDWRELREEVKKHLPEGSLSDEINSSEFMQYVEERVDIDSLIDWMCIEAIYGNSDTSNVRVYKYEGGKWRWMLFDMDLSLRSLDQNYNYLKRLFNEDGYGAGLSSHMHRLVFYNKTYRKKFVERYAFFLNKVITIERITALTDAMAAEIRPEMQRNIERWGEPASVEKWESNIKRLKTNAEKRLKQAKQNLQDTFGLSDERMRELFG